VSVSKPADGVPRIAAVVVTYNRFELLKQCIAALRGQSASLYEIIVVDNGCTDETPDWLAGQADLVVIRQENQGGAGGQATGIRVAYERGHDWFWCMDDDTLPHADALEQFTASPRFEDADTGILASLVLWKDGTAHVLNFPTLEIASNWLPFVLADPNLRMTRASFVSVLIARRAVAAVGLPIREFFIWFDDSEYTSRITARFRGYLVVRSLVLHATPENKGISVNELRRSDHWKYLYGMRNLVYMIRSSTSSRRQKAREILGLMRTHLRWAIQGRLPWSTLLWIWRGMFFNPRIEMVSETTIAEQSKELINPSAP
jgi:GT2 family glycosyltransferase